MTAPRVRQKSIIVVPPYGSALLKGMVPSGAYEVIWGDCVDPGVVMGSYSTAEAANAAAALVGEQLARMGSAPRRVSMYEDPPIESAWAKLAKERGWMTSSRYWNLEATERVTRLGLREFIYRESLFLWMLNRIDLATGGDA